MRMDLFRVEWTSVYDHISQDELGFVERFFGRGDDGTYYVDNDVLAEILADAKEEKIPAPKDLITAIRKELKKGEGFSFSIG